MDIGEEEVSGFTSDQYFRPFAGQRLMAAQAEEVAGRTSLRDVSMRHVADNISGLFVDLFGNREGGPTGLLRILTWRYRLRAIGIVLVVTAVVCLALTALL